MNIIELPKIENIGYPTNQHNYKESHKKAVELQIKKFGKKEFDELKNWVNTNIGDDELAGSHDEEGNIMIRKDVPEHLKEQLIYHERIEKCLMEEEKLTI
jgi:hypothetical protein